MIDKKDEKILEELARDAKQTSKQISKRTLIPITTVHNRIKKLERLGIIKNYTIQLNDQALGTLSAYVMILVDYKALNGGRGSQHELIQSLQVNPAVEYACMLTGSFDIMIKIRVKDTPELNEFVTKHLRNMDGIQSTQTMIILNET